MPVDEESSKSLRYGYLDPLQGSRNYGDAIIDHATQSVLSEHLPAPFVRLNPFSDKPPGEALEFILAPGVTTLTEGDRPFMSILQDVPCPVYCLAGNVWGAVTGRPGILIRNRILFSEPPETPSVSVPRGLAAPVGARDSFTDRLLRDNQIESVYNGCPTLHLPQDDVGDDGYLLFSFGRNHVRQQARAGRILSRTLPVVGLCHEPGDKARYEAAGWRFPLIEYDGDVELYLSYLKRARVVVTGRLHGALPAVAYHKPVFYFGTLDSRTSILNDLGISIHRYGELGGALERATTACNRSLIATFRERIDTFTRAIAHRHTH